MNRMLMDFCGVVHSQAEIMEATDSTSVYIIKIQSPCHANFTLKDHCTYKITEAKGRNYKINKVDTAETNG